MVSMKVAIKVGRIGGQRVVTFAKGFSGLVPPKWLWRLADGDKEFLIDEKDRWITPAEAFRRWKVARKAWRTRKRGNQLCLDL